MNTQDFRNDPEARVTALLLGELSAAEAEAVRTAIQQDPELAQLHDRLQRAIALIRGAIGTRPAVDPTPRLSKAKREALLARFRVVPLNTGSPKHRTNRWVSALRLAALLILLGIVGFSLLAPNYVRTRGKAMSSRIDRSQRQLDRRAGRAVAVDPSAVTPEPQRQAQSWYRMSASQGDTVQGLAGGTGGYDGAKGSSSDKDSAGRAGPAAPSGRGGRIEIALPKLNEPPSNTRYALPASAPTAPSAGAIVGETLPVVASDLGLQLPLVTSTLSTLPSQDTQFDSDGTTEGVPVLGGAPTLGRLFQNRGYGAFEPANQPGAPSTSEQISATGVAGDTVVASRPNVFSRNENVGPTVSEWGTAWAETSNAEIDQDVETAAADLNNLPALGLAAAELPQSAARGVTRGRPLAVTPAPIRAGIEREMLESEAEPAQESADSGDLPTSGQSLERYPAGPEAGEAIELFKKAPARTSAGRTERGGVALYANNADAGLDEQSLQRLTSRFGRQPQPTEGRESLAIEERLGYAVTPADTRTGEAAGGRAGGSFVSKGQPLAEDMPVQAEDFFMSQAVPSPTRGAGPTDALKPQPKTEAEGLGERLSEFKQSVVEGFRQSRQLAREGQRMQTSEGQRALSRSEVEGLRESLQPLVRERQRVRLGLESARALRLEEPQARVEPMPAIRPGAVIEAAREGILPIGQDDVVLYDMSPMQDDKNKLGEITPVSPEGNTAVELSFSDGRLAQPQANGLNFEELAKRKDETRAGLAKSVQDQLQEIPADAEIKIAGKPLAPLPAPVEPPEQLSRLADEYQAPPKSPPPVPQPEIATTQNPFSTFSLNVSDVSFKLAAASLEQGRMPDPGSIRSEEFINAFDYHDPEPGPGRRVGVSWARARYPFAHNRDLLRFGVQTAAQGREAHRPLNVVLCLDNSGSMERADRVAILREAMNVLAGQLQPNDRISVVAFARTARLWVDALPGSQASELVERVGNLSPEGGTNLEEALRLAYATARRHFVPGGINRVVLLTDGAANLGTVDPESLRTEVIAQRQSGLALDCFGVGWEGYNDDLLENLSRNADGRYGFLNTPEEAATEFAHQLAGALQVAASDVKVQVEFNPSRVKTYRQIGYAKHQLTKEQFRDNTVDAAEIGGAESGNALYVIETDANGTGAIGVVRVRFKVPSTGQVEETEWVIPYAGQAPDLIDAPPAMRLTATASAFSEWLATSPYAAEVRPAELLQLLRGAPEAFELDPRPRQLETMIRQAGSIAGQ